MSFPRALTPMIASLALVACADGGDRRDMHPRDIAGTSDHAVSVAGAPQRSGFVGPLEYVFDDSMLAEAEIDLSVPPLHEESVFAIKLIPRDSLSNVGSGQCAFAPRGAKDGCTAEDEVGVAMAFLARPIGEYRRAFAPSDLSPAALPAESIDGSAGFTYRETSDDGMIEYSFVPLSGRTLLIAQRHHDERAGDTLAMQRVIGSLRLRGLAAKGVSPAAG